MNIFIHIGFPKTGSSAIQAHLHLNRDWLLEQGMLFPETGHSPGFGHVLLFEDKTFAMFDELRSELDRHQANGIRSAVLSWEGVAQMGPVKLERVAQCLQGHELKIVGYIREQSEVIQSGYFQAAKQRAQKRVMADYLRSKKLISPKHIDYAHTLGKMSRAFGRESLCLRVYERGQLLAGDIVLDFFNILGISPGPGFVKSEQEQNPSLDPGAVRLLNILDGYFDDPEGREKLVDALLTDIRLSGARGKYFLGKEQVEAIRDHYRHSNSEVARNYLGRASGDLFSSGKVTYASDAQDFAAYGAAHLDELHRLVDYRPWSGQELAGVDLQQIASPAAGWGLAEPWGVWSDQGESFLRFRLLLTRTAPTASRLVITLQGDYYGDNNVTTVSAPGVERIETSLVDGRLEIALAALDARGTVEIKLKHHRPVSPASVGESNDVRTLAYGLRSITYVVSG